MGFGLSLALAFAGALSAEAAAPPAHRETKERVSPAQRQLIVAGPMAMAVAGDLEGARTSFESLVEWVRAGSGPDSLAEADLLSSFAVELCNNDYQEASIPYFKRAVDAFRARFGENHPETALAVTDYGRALEEAYPSEERPEAVAAFREALDIRLATLGVNNAETAMSMSYLAKALSLSGRPKHEGAELEEIIGLLRRAIVAIEAAPNALPRDEYSIRSRLVTVLRDSGREREARAEEKALIHASDHPIAAQVRNARVAAEQDAAEDAAEAARKAAEEALRTVT